MGQAGSRSYCSNGFPAAGDYEARSESAALPDFPIATAVQLLGARQTMSDTELVRRFREAIRSA